MRFLLIFLFLCTTACVSTPRATIHGESDADALKRMTDAIIEDIGGRKDADCQLAKAVYAPEEAMDIEIRCTTGPTFSFQCQFENSGRPCLKGAGEYVFRFEGFDNSVKYRRAYFLLDSEADDADPCDRNDAMGYSFVEFNTGWSFFIGFSKIYGLPLPGECEVITVTSISQAYTQL